MVVLLFRYLHNFIPEHRGRHEHCDEYDKGDHSTRDHAALGSLTFFAFLSLVEVRVPIGVVGCAHRAHHAREPRFAQLVTTGRTADAPVHWAFPEMIGVVECAPKSFVDVDRLRSVQASSTSRTLLTFFRDVVEVISLDAESTIGCTWERRLRRDALKAFPVRGVEIERISGGTVRLLQHNDSPFKTPFLVEPSLLYPPRIVHDAVDIRVVVRLVPQERRGCLHLGNAAVEDAVHSV